MKVGILGSGDVGRALGHGFLGRGDEVRMGAREARNDKVAAWTREAGPRASGGTFTEAARWGDLLVLATLGSATEEALRRAGPEHFCGKVVLDATNPLDLSGDVPRLSVGWSDSGGERIQRALPGASVVKAFNTVGHAHMVRPRFEGGPPDMFIAGDDDAAKATVARVCKDFGWGVVDLGGIEASRHLEALAMVWILHGLRSGSWRHAFRLLPPQK